MLLHRKSCSWFYRIICISVLYCPWSNMFVFYKLASLPTRLMRVGDMVPPLLVNIILCEWGSRPENLSVIFYDCFFYECALCYTEKYYCACIYMYSFPFRSLTFFVTSMAWLFAYHICFSMTKSQESNISQILLHLWSKKQTFFPDCLTQWYLMMDWVAGSSNTKPFPFQFQFIM